jgi:hypothetical protein
MKKTILFFSLLTFSITISFSQTWGTAGTGIKGSFTSLITYKGNLYAGGIDSLNGKAIHVAKWNGTIWSEADTGLAGNITAVGIYSDKLYAGTEFKEGKQSFYYLLCWNDTAWKPVQTFNGPVNALCAFNGALYVGGKFTKAGDTINARFMAKWNDTIWQPVRGIPNNVRALAVYHQKIYAGGQFKGVYRWMGHSWEDVYNGKGIHINDGFIKAFTVYDDELYACGEFNYLAKWNNENWEIAGTFNDGGNTMAAYNGAIYTGGDFTAVPNFDHAYHIAKLSALGWECLGGVIYWPGDCKPYTGTVWSLAEYKGDLYIGGQFMIAGGKVINNIAKWNCPQQTKQ